MTRELTITEMFQNVARTSNNGRQAMSKRSFLVSEMVHDDVMISSLRVYCFVMVPVLRSA